MTPGNLFRLQAPHGPCDNMRELIVFPPTRKRLKEVFLDRYRRQQHPAEMLNCAAHMILTIDAPEEP